MKDRLLQRHGTPALPRGRSDGTSISHRRHAVVCLGCFFLF
jgi:hypothetical protein